MSALGSSLFTHLGLRPSEMERLPPRIAALMEQEELRSERAISWVQLGLTISFAVLYFLAPRPVDAAMLDEPVPWALGSYFIFTMVRLVLSYRGWLPGWFLLLSMLADVVLLYSLLWQFHMSYNQPASFSLRVPTFTHIFIFIAVRALRYDPRFVITQGVLAFAGWALIVALAIWQMGPDAITRSFVAYMKGDGILIGAEADKLISIIAVTAVLGATLYRARYTLLTAVREGAASREMRRYFGAGVADAITDRATAPMAGDAEARDAAILMLDLRGFTPLAATLAPAETVRILTRYQSLVIPIIERHGGVIDKFLGDGVMATFGAVSPLPTAAADALAALGAVVDVAERWSGDLAADGHRALPINGAVVAGPVVAATVGTERRLEFTVIGSAVNLAAKLEKHNKTAGTMALTTAETYALARQQGFRRRGTNIPAATVAGVSDPLHLVRLG
ncbi:adenylate/guanylate cyclase domain-containing protein [Acuticoccus sp. I52.16.1]|uniref:adenylate/guanylate cyclase domain-containing protein n=1 Tax=Acuticoccus sp. I52.16.1 TaxID=2928472 RepID=UPI001FD5F5E7|nr:adenylate/guanylate cyclase domain-containing protein [Acuticoccus sp. I52.16.1]UOM33966.1 adenylate/guanylate cyclase domain-containing protein [Acuticoccus sp. I52.16.1]